MHGSRIRVDKTDSSSAHPIQSNLKASVRGHNLDARWLFIPVQRINAQSQSAEF